MMLVTRKFEFDSAHKLEGLGVNESNLHGHRYVLEVSVNGPVKNDVVMDIAKIKEVVNQEVMENLDHHNLNDLIENPTMENIAMWIWNQLKDKLDMLSEVKLYETPNNYVTYNGE